MFLYVFSCVFICFFIWFYMIFIWLSFVIAKGSIYLSESSPRHRRSMRFSYDFICFSCDFMWFSYDFTWFLYDFTFFLYDFWRCGRIFRMSRFLNFNVFPDFERSTGNSNVRPEIPTTTECFGCPVFLNFDVFLLRMLFTSSGVVATCSLRHYAFTNWLQKRWGSAHAVRI